MRLIADYPLLRKELVEQSQQLQTYVIRGLFGLLLYFGGLLVIYGRGGAIQANVSLGAGRETFWNIVYLEALVIYLFVPAMMAGSLAGEKERASLPLLLLTTLPPWDILLQKLLSRLIPTLTLIVFSFPILAAAYSFGGVPRDELLLAGAMLLIWAVQLSTISLACSAFSGTTVSALMGSYLITAVLFLVFSGFNDLQRGSFAVPRSYLPFFYAQGRLQLNSTPQGFVRCGLLVAFALVMARASLFSRAFTTPTNFILRFFRALDRFWNEANSLTGGVVLVDDRNQFPANNPVAWRETAKKSLGTFRYLFRVLVLIETPILVVCQFANVSGQPSHSSVSSLLFITWGIGSALLCVHASSVIAGERSRQTLETLLATPLRGDRIVREKLAGVRRLICVLLVPLGTIFLYQHWFRDYDQDFRYLLRSVVLTLVLLGAQVWLCCWIGLRNRSQLRAIVASMLALILLNAIPPTLAYLGTNVLQRTEWWMPHLTLASPVSLIRLTEAADRSNSLLDSLRLKWNDELWFWAPVCGWLIFAGLLRFWCLWQADSQLGRVPVSASEPPTTRSNS